MACRDVYRLDMAGERFSGLLAHTIDSIRETWSIRYPALMIWRCCRKQGRRSLGSLMLITREGYMTQRQPAAGGPFHALPCSSCGCLDLDSCITYSQNAPRDSANETDQPTLMRYSPAAGNMGGKGWDGPKSRTWKAAAECG